MTFLAIALYIAVSLLNVSALLASIQSIGTLEHNQQTYRDELAFCIFIGFIPVAGFILGLFGTGFYEHGFQLRRRTK